MRLELIKSFFAFILNKTCNKLIVNLFLKLFCLNKKIEKEKQNSNIIFKTKTKSLVKINFQKKNKKKKY
jgi:hypothetical protein